MAYGSWCQPSEPKKGLSGGRVSFGSKGGGLEIFYGDGIHPVPARIGDVIAFPSFIMHRALTVEDGERWSLVSWILGDDPLK